MSYDEKYAGLGLQFIQPEAIPDVDECIWLLSHLDGVIGSIEEQLHLSMAPGGRTDLTWRAKASRALRHTKSLRNRTQTRLGQLRRQKAVTFEAVFMAAAREILPKETFSEILSETHARMEEST